MPWHSRKTSYSRKRKGPKKTHRKPFSWKKRTPMKKRRSLKMGKKFIRKGRSTVKGRSFFDPVAAAALGKSAAASGVTLSPALAAAAEAGVSANLSSVMTFRGPHIPLPQRYRCKMHWVEDFGISEYTGDTTNIKFFRGNSIWDPDYSIGISQKSAQYTNLLGSIYLNYRVSAVRVQITMAQFLDDQAGLSMPVKAILFPTIQSVSYLNASVPPSMEAWDVATFPHKQKVLGNDYTDSSMRTMSLYVKVKDMFAVPDLADVGFIGQMPNGRIPQGGTDPSLVFLVGMCQGAATNSGGVEALSCRAHITYYVELFNPIAPTGEFGDVLPPQGDDDDFGDAFEDMDINEVHSELFAKRTAIL